MNFQVTINTCRVCMKTDQGQSLMEDEDLQSKFVFTTRLTLSADDNMPSLICAKCILRLRVAHEFIQLAHESELNLKAFLTKISNDFQMVTKLNTATTSVSMAHEEEELLLLVSDNDAAEEATPVEKTLDKSSAQKTAIKKSSCTKEEKTKSQSLVHIIKQEQPQTDEHEVEEEQRTAFELYEDTNFSDSNTNGMKHAVGYSEQNMNVKVLYISEELSEEECDSQNEMEVYEESSHQNCEPQSEAVEQLGHGESYLREYEVLVDNEASNSNMEFITNATDLESHKEEEKEEEELQLYEHTDHLLQAEQEADIMHTEVLGEIESIADNAEATHAELPATTRVEAKYKAPRKAATNRGMSKTKKPSSPSMSTRFFCVKCNRDFSTKTNLTRHMATHEGSRPYQCSVCCKGFTQNGSLKQHMLTHTGEKPYVCKICSRGFSQCKSLVFHMRRHTGNKPFQCDTCKMLFRQKDGLKSHILKHHMITAQAGNSETLICTICKKSLMDKYDLQEHMRRHVNNGKNVSVLEVLPSGSSSADSTDLMWTMDDSGLLSEKPTFMSDEVGPHIDETHVVDIMATSTDEPSRAKKFQCRKCFKCFAIKKNLIRHLSIHASELFQCKTCEIAFDTNYAFKVHCVREHKEAGINLNECEECQMVFPNASQLEDHNNAAHFLNCAQCPELRYKSEKQLMEHMLEHDLNEVDSSV